MKLPQIFVLLVAALALAAPRALAIDTRALSYIETQVDLIENGESVSAPKTTALSGVPFESIVGQPADDNPDAFIVGIALKGNVSSVSGSAKFDLTVTLREADANHSSGRVQVRTYKVKEYLLLGDADFGQDVKIKLSETRFIRLKFTEVDRAKLTGLKSATTRPLN